MTRYHVVGIGGAGMSAIARLLLARGDEVSGSDAGHWPLSDALVREGATVYDSFAAEHVAGADRVVRSSAYKADHVEVAAAQSRGIPIWKRDDAWRSLAEGKRVVAIAGTHGKTTTTGLTWSAIRAGGIDASLLCGGELRGLGTNAHAGRDDVLVIEADEYDRAFLALEPRVAVVTNVDHDHVDVFPTRADYASAFRDFAGRVDPAGALICCADDAGAADLATWSAANARADVVTYGQDPAALYTFWRTEDPTGVFALAERSHLRTDRTAYRLRIPGRHNALNAAAALLAADRLGVPRESARAGLEEFRGIARRLEPLGTVGRVLVVDDYAHHPAEIGAGLAAFSERPGRLLLVFQPHTPSRLRAFFDDFGVAIRGADLSVVIETFTSAREAAEPVSYARKLAESTGGRYAADGDQAARIIADEAREGDVVLVMGAGDVRPVGERILALLRARAAV